MSTNPDRLTVLVWLADRHEMTNVSDEELLTVCLVLATDPGNGTPKAVKDAAKRLRFPLLSAPVQATVVFPDGDSYPLTRDDLTILGVDE